MINMPQLILSRFDKLSLDWMFGNWSPGLHALPAYFTKPLALRAVANFKMTLETYLPVGLLNSMLLNGNDCPPILRFSS